MPLPWLWKAGEQVGWMLTVRSAKDQRKNAWLMAGRFVFEREDTVIFPESIREIL